MSKLTWQDVEAAKGAQSIEDPGVVVGGRQTPSRLFPPGYIAGYRIGFATGSGVIKVAPGIMDIDGVAVSNAADYYIEESDWQCSFLGNTTVYLYVGKGPEFKVFAQAPEWNSTLYAYYHPRFQYRYIGKLVINSAETIERVINAYAAESTDVEADSVKTYSLVDDAVIEAKVNAADFLDIPTDETLAAHWTFNGDVKDSSGNGQDLTAVGAPTYPTAGVVGQMAALDGVSDYFSVSESPAFPLATSTAWSVAFWVKADATAQNQGWSRIFSYGRDASNKLSFYINDLSNSLRYRMYDGGVDSGAETQLDMACFDGTMHFGCITCTAGTFKFYLDGVLVATSEDFFTYDISDGTNSFFVASSTSGTAQLLGNVDEIRVYSHVLTAGQVKSLYLYPGGLSYSLITADHIAANTISAGEIAAGTLNAMVADINSYLIIAADGAGGFVAGDYTAAGGPINGNTRFFVDRDNLQFDVYDGAGWVTRTQLGEISGAGYSFWTSDNLKVGGSKAEPPCKIYASNLASSSESVSGNTIAALVGNIPQIELLDVAGGASRIAFSQVGSLEASIIYFQHSTGQLNLYVGGVNSLIVSSTRIFNSVQMQAGLEGGVVAPDYSFSGDTDTGFMRAAANDIGVVVGGAYAMRIQATNTYHYNNVVPIVSSTYDLGTSAILWRYLYVDQVRFTGTYPYLADSGNYIEIESQYGGTRIGMNNGTWSHFQTDSTSGFYFYTNVVSAGKFAQNAYGSASAPSYTWWGDQDTGIYRNAANSIGFSAGNSLRMYINSTTIYMTGNITSSGGHTFNSGTYNKDGTVSLPAYTFTNDQNTGIYSISADHLGITTGGVLKATFDSTGLELHVAGSEFYNPSSHDSVGTLKLFPYSTSTTIYLGTWYPGSSGARHTFNWASILPTGTKAVLITCMFHLVSSASGLCQARVNFDDDNTITPVYSHNVSQASGLFTAAGGSQHGASTDHTMIVPVDGSKYFYGYVNTFSNVSTLSLYIRILGYYI